MRYPAVSGSFYPSSPAALARQVKELLAKAREEMPARQEAGAKSPGIKAIVCPHAGYDYSGLTAAYSFAAARELLERPSTTAIIIGPNHTGAGRLVSVSLDDWMTPVGKSMTDLPLAGAIIKSDPLFSRNEQAHFREHSIEVQLPFLQAINPLAKIVAICLMAQDGLTSRRVGEAIYKTVKRPEFKDRNIIVIASSDFEHYMSGKQAEALDRQPLEFIRQLDDDEFQDEVEGKNLSICGHGAIAAAMRYAKLAGCKKAELLRYTNSGKETKGDEGSVVSYASFVIS